MGRPTKAEKAIIDERRTQAIAMRTRGETWDRIGQTLGYASGAAACNDVTRALEERARALTEQADSLRELELARLDALYAAAWAVLEREHVVVSGGKIVKDGRRKLRDDGPVLAAIDRLVRISERRAKLLGIDSPVKIEAGVTVDARDSAIDKLRGMLAEVQTNRQETGEVVVRPTPASNRNGHDGNGANGDG